VVEHYDGSQQLEQLIDQAENTGIFMGNFQGPWLKHAKNNQKNMA
jgi:hypothetical protein